MKRKIIFTISILLMGVCALKAQQTGQNFDLNTAQSNTNNTYLARDYVKLLPGFSVKPLSTYSFNAKIDETVTCSPDYKNTVVFDPSSSTYILKRNLATTNEVGSIPGSFDVSPSGGALYNIPIAVPVGTAGTNPSLGITYNSQAGNGIMGMGWNLTGLSAITRIGTTIYHDGEVLGITFDDTKDRLMFDGQRLISTNITTPGLNGTDFRTENESFIRVTKQGTGTDIWFIAETKDGLTMEFGKTGTEGDGRLQANETSGAGLKYISWYLKKVTDKNGNSFKYNYNVGINEITIKSIEYSGNKILFGYNQRTDSWNALIHNSSVNQSVLLAQITIYSGNSIVSKYKFNYTDQFGKSCLYEIFQEDGNGKSLNSTAFSWDKPVFNNSYTKTNTSGDKTWYMPGDYNGDGLIDILNPGPTSCTIIFGTTNGAIGLNKSGNYAHSYFYDNWTAIRQSCSPNNGYVPSSLSGFGFDDIKTTNYTGDFDGDGQSDIMVFNEEYDYNYATLCPYLSSRSASNPFDLNYMKTNLLTKRPGFVCTLYGYSGTSLVARRAFTISNLPTASSIDFNQDGRTDFMINNDVFTLNPGNNAWEKIGTTSNAANLQRSTGGDFNGDGKVDYLKINEYADYNAYDGTMYLWDNTSKGYVTASAPIGPDEKLLGSADINGDGRADLSMLSTEVSRIDPIIGPVKSRRLYFKGYNTTVLTDLGYFEKPYPTHIQSCDINGDERPDIAVFRHDTIDRIFYSTGQTGFSILAMNEKLSGKSYFSDFDGNGIDELSACYDQKYFKFATGKKGYLVNGIINGLNHKTNITFKTLTDNTDPSFYTKTNQGAAPLINITAPIVVVSSVNADNGLTTGPTIQTTVNYKYTDARVHLSGKGFLGFGKREVINTALLQTVVVQTDIEQTFYTMSKQTTSITQGIEQSKTISEFGVEVISGKRIFAHPTKTTVTDYIKNATISTNYSFDGTPAKPYLGNGNMTKQDVVYSTGTTVPITDMTATNEYQDFIAAGSYLANKPQLVVTTQKHKDDENSYVSKVHFEYNTTTGALIEKKDHYELTADKIITTTYLYWPDGNLKSEKIAYPDLLYNSGTKTFSNTITEKLISYQYNSNGRFLMSKTEPNNFVTEYTYDEATGNVLTAKSPDGFVTRSDYGSFGKLIKTTNQDGTWNAVNFSWITSEVPTGAVYSSTTTGTASPPVTRYYDKLAREIKTVSVDFKDRNVNLDIAYKPNGYIDYQTLPYFDGANSVKKFVTMENGLVKEEFFDLNELKTTYQYTGNTIKTILPGTNHFNEKTFNSLGKLKTSKDALNNEVNYIYNSKGLPGTIQAAGTSVDMVYDNYGNQTELNDPSAGKRYYTYNSIGQLYKQTDDKNNVIVNQYDVLGRIIKQYVGNQTVDYLYDTKIKGLISKITNSNGTSVEYFYDTSKGRLISQKEIIDLQSFITAYQYNSNGDLWKITYPSGFILEHVYDTKGNLREVKKENGTTIWKATDSNASGQYTGYVLGNNKHAYTRDYNKYGAVTSIATTGVVNLSYVYDPSTRNMMSRTNNIRSITENFSYDDLDRLKTWGVGTSYNINYTDIKINIKSDAGTGNYVYQSGNHKLDNIPGAVIEIQKTHNLQFNDMNNINHIDEFPSSTNTAGYSMDFTYDYEQNRRKVVLAKDNNLSNPILTRYYVGGLYEQEERGTAIRKLDYIVGGDGLAAIHVNNGNLDTIYYLHTDHQGSWIAVTNDMDLTIKEQNFDPWGRRRNPTNWTYTGVPTNFPFVRGYTGHEHMNEFGLINMNGRVYDPILGMFLSPDDNIQNPEMPINYNRFAYCFGNPLKYTDPNGEWIHLVIGAIIGGIQGYMTGKSAGLSGGKLFLATIAGAGVGAFSGGIANAIATGGGVMANTMAIVVASHVNSVGMMATIGAAGIEVPYTLGIGIASITMGNQGGEFGYIGKPGNSALANFGYLLGAMANASDILRGFNKNNIGDIDLVTEHSDGVGHSAIVEPESETGGNYGTLKSDGSMVDPDGIISVGPNQTDGNSWHWKKGHNSWNTYSNGSTKHPVWRETIQLNRNSVCNYAKHLNSRINAGKFIYSVEVSSCVTHTSRALNLSGVFNIGIHPYLLHAQMYLRNLGLRPSLFSYYTTQY